MKTTYLLLSSALLLGCVSACNTSGQKSKEMKTDDGSITTVETAGSKLTICDLSLVKDTIEVPLSEFVEDCRIVRFETSEEYPKFMASPDINTEDFMAAVDFLSVREDVDPDKIGIIGICGWGGMALNAAALDTRIKATVASTMYDMTRVNANGYFDSEDSEEARYAKKQSLNTLRTEEYRKGEYSRGGGCVPLPVPEDAPFFVKDYSEYYKGRCYHKRSLNSNDGWNSIGCMSFMNQPILKYSNEIRSAVLIVHGEKAHSYYFGKDAYENMIKDSKYTSNKELLTIPGAVHTDLYDNLDVIPFDKIQKFFEENGVG